MVTFEHDYTGSLAETYLDSSEKADSLIFLQGMSGVTFTMQIPNTHFFADKVVNKAEIELTALELPEDMMGPFGPVAQMIISEVTDTSLIIIEDVVFALERSDLANIFGGDYDEELSPVKIRMNIAAHLRKMSLGLASDTIQITVLARPEIAQRLVLGGPGHADAPAILKVNFTNL